MLFLLLGLLCQESRLSLCTVTCRRWNLVHIKGFGHIESFGCVVALLLACLSVFMFSRCSLGIDGKSHRALRLNFPWLDSIFVICEAQSAGSHIVLECPETGFLRHC